MAISVAMAAYNGEMYIKEQLDSILCQLEKEDEIVISLDPSTDSTKKIIDGYNDSRIHCIPGLGKGLIKNFENAISHCKNDIIFLCDQDDIWMDNKVKTVKEAFDIDTLCVCHDCIMVHKVKEDVLYDSFFSTRNSKTGILKNMIFNSYLGCCMAFRKELVPFILPFPDKLPMHDQYIGLVAEKKGKSKFINDKLIYYRRHDNNSSEDVHSGIGQMIQWRMQIIKAYMSVK